MARMRRALAQPARAGWAIAAPFVLVVAGLNLVLPLDPTPDSKAPGAKPPSATTPAYHALGAARPQPAGDLIVIFQPQATSADLTRALRDSGARLVDGPTAADAYVLDVPLAERDAALARLRADSAISLAQPVDPTERP